MENITEGWMALVQGEYLGGDPEISPHQTPGHTSPIPVTTQVSVDVRLPNTYNPYLPHELEPMDIEGYQRTQGDQGEPGSPGAPGPQGALQAQRAQAPTDEQPQPQQESMKGLEEAAPEGGAKPQGWMALVQGEYLGGDPEISPDQTPDHASPIPQTTQVSADIKLTHSYNVNFPHEPRPGA